MKIFLSYSHTDETFRRELEVHLSGLKRRGLVETWSDRKILPGEKWGTEIDTNLQSSNVIIFLISADFLASDYCYDIEAKTALGMHADGRATLIPVIVRPCDWSESPFSTFQALPPEAKPISKWEDRDEAWMKTAHGIKQLISRPLPLQTEITPSSAPLITLSFWEFLEDTEIKLSNGNGGPQPKLSDIFVPPDIKILTDDTEKLSRIVSSMTLKQKNGNFLVFGDEQSGKTALAKSITRLLANEGEHALLLQGRDLKASTLDALVQEQASKQFNNPKLFNTTKNKTVIIDNYSDCRLNKKYQNILLESLKRDFPRIIILASDTFQFIASEISALDGFLKYEILRFGNERRANLAEKWIRLGKEEVISDSELHNGIDALKTHLDSFVKRNIVPSKPVFLISILQASETLTSQAVELTSSGHCYQFLIYRLFEKAHIKRSEVDTVVNVLTEFAGYLLNNNGRDTDSSLSDFFLTYEKKYIKIRDRQLINTLISAGLLLETEGKIRFRHKYIYYFYAGKHLADNLAKAPSHLAQIEQLFQNLHKAECANIIIFLTHHTKDPRVLDGVQSSLSKLFSDQPAAALEPKELDFMKEFLDRIPQLVIEQRDIEQERRESAVASDNAERLEAELDEKTNELDPGEILAQINRTFKGIEIIGQIVRNRHGSLERDALFSLVESAVFSGLRFLHFFLVLSDKSKDEIVKSISYMLKENPTIENSKLEKEAKDLFMLMSYGVIYGVIRKVAFSIGSKEAAEIYEAIKSRYPMPSVKLINQAIELQFTKKIEVKSLRALSDEFSGNVVCHRMLKEIIIQHLYMHHVDFRDKQKIAETLRLPMPSQRMIQANTKLETA